MSVLSFFLGLSGGIALLGWYHRHSNARLKAILKALKSDVTEIALPDSSRLTLAIAQQQNIQHQLEQQLQTYEQILHLAPVGYLQVDDENRLLDCNVAAKDLLGFNLDNSLGQPRLLLELVRSYELDELIEQTRLVGKPCQREWTFYLINTDPANIVEPHPYALRGYAFPLGKHQIGIFLESRQEAIALLQQRDRWASDLAHEFKTPLTSIRLVAETLQTRLEPPLRTWIDRLINETIRLNTLVQDLLELSQIDRASFHSLRLTTTDLAQLIQSVWGNLEPLSRKKHLQLDYRGPESLLVQVDEPRIHRLLVNLLDNAIQYSPAEQFVRVELQVEPAVARTFGLSQVCIHVIDSGSGFVEKDLPHVFERFYRADPSRSRLPSPSNPSDSSLAADAVDPKSTATSLNASNLNGSPFFPQYSSSGLGLAIVQQIVEAHQGTVRASNHPETRGAWLQVRLPYRLP